MIRKANFQDLEAINQIYNQEVDASIFNISIAHTTLEERQKWFESHGDKHPVLVKEASEGVIAWACLSPWTNFDSLSRTVEITIFIAVTGRGKGLGKLMIAEILKIGKALNHRVFIARIIEGNDISVRLFKGFGFKQVGRLPEIGEKNGQRFTALIFQKNLS